jgi:HSP90 family molecular chaperone
LGVLFKSVIKLFIKEIEKQAFKKNKVFNNIINKYSSTEIIPIEEQAHFIEEISQVIEENKSTALWQDMHLKIRKGISYFFK